MKNGSRPLSEVMRSTSLPRAGIIPAGAGSTHGSAATVAPPRDHPRMCGEHRQRSSSRCMNLGSSPHVRGAPSAPRASRTAPWDHPRMCGEHQDVLDWLRPGAGIIPACAGSTESPSALSSLKRDHPRMCGEHRFVLVWSCAGWGSSPHVRGARAAAPPGNKSDGIIPACAGSTLFLGEIARAVRDHPRMCGEHITSTAHADVLWGSSPHVRGAPLPSCQWSGGRRDHPRMCREHFVTAQTEHCQRGIIPACAGSTSAA